jgi:hypothetical protein
MSARIEVLAKTRIGEQDVTDQEKAFLERVILQSEGQRAIDSTGSFFEKAEAAKGLAIRGLELLGKQLQSIGSEKKYRRVSPIQGAVENVLFIRTQVDPFVDPLLNLLPGLRVSWGSESLNQVIVHSSRGLELHDRSKRKLFPDTTEDLSALFADGKIVDPALMSNFSLYNYVDILTNYSSVIKQQLG